MSPPGLVTLERCCQRSSSPFLLSPLPVCSPLCHTAFVCLPRPCPAPGLADRCTALLCGVSAIINSPLCPLFVLREDFLYCTINYQLTSSKAPSQQDLLPSVGLSARPESSLPPQDVSRAAVTLAAA